MKGSLLWMGHSSLIYKLLSLLKCFLECQIENLKLDKQAYACTLSCLCLDLFICII